ncbi:MAG: hypothetical protein ACRD28_00880 [Acidobacteriaceae bacterium]
MNHAVRCFELILSVALLSAGLSCAGSAPNEAIGAPNEAIGAPNEATYVYVGTTNGINVYDAAANGELTLVSGSPFTTPAGILIGSNGNYLITLATYYAYSYHVASNGAIGGQASEIDTQDYPGGGNCDGYSPGTRGLASLSHSGQNLYVVFHIYSGDCPDSIQTFNITNSGDLIFNGSIMTGGNGIGVGLGNYPGLIQAPTITASDTFAYAAGDFDCCNPPGAGGFSGYKLGSNGEMQNWTFHVSSPDNYTPLDLTADSTNHLAAAVGYGDVESFPVQRQLASYTVDGQGNLSTIGTAENMPYPNVTPNYLNISPSGKLLAVAGNNGLQVFHFDGANPITPYSGVLTTAEIDQIQWDNNNHLFALSDEEDELYVFTITPTSIAPAPGSPYAISSPNALAVVVNGKQL